MIYQTLLTRAAKTFTPTVAQTLRNVVPTLEKSVAEVATIAKHAKGSQIGSVFSALAQAGEKLVGNDGVVSFTTRQSAKHANASVVTVIFKKGNEVVAKMASTVSPKGQKTGGLINQHVNGVVVPGRFRWAENTTASAEKIKMLAQKLGVDISSATDRIRNARFLGKDLSSEAVLKDTILGKFVTKFNRVPSYSPKDDAFAYFSSAYKRLRRMPNLEAIPCEPNWFDGSTSAVDLFATGNLSPEIHRRFCG